MDFNGMNIGEVSYLAGELGSYASRVDAVRGAVDAIVQRTQANWAGEDASRFVSGWQSSRAGLMATAQDMRALGRWASSKAYSQWRVSSL